MTVSHLLIVNVNTPNLASGNTDRYTDIMSTFNPTFLPHTDSTNVTAVSAVSAERIIDTAKKTLAIEAQGILNLLPRIDQAFVYAVHLLLNCTGRVVVSGMGKSGHVGRKIAATLASTGTPAFFMHPAEAAHGDLGMLLANDVLITLSNSGTTEEIVSMMPSLRRLGMPMIAMTGHADSLLAQFATVHLNVGVDQEACPLDLAPTASTSAALAMGDALAMATLSARGFTAQDFARSHPGGALGRKLLTHVRDLMRIKEALPAVTSDCLIPAALIEMTRKGMGMTAVLDTHSKQLIGIFTDGDVRRAIESVGDIRSHTVAQHMSHQPLTIYASAMAVDAVKLMDETRKNQLLVVDDTLPNCPLVGALHLHDLMKAKIV
jgi:arabinose-5-phosphate isomerase